MSKPRVLILSSEAQSLDVVVLGEEFTVKKAQDVLGLVGDASGLTTTQLASALGTYHPRVLAVDASLDSWPIASFLAGIPGVEVVVVGDDPQDRIDEARRSGLIAGHVPSGSSNSAIREAVQRAAIPINIALDYFAEHARPYAPPAFVVAFDPGTPLSDRVTGHFRGTHLDNTGTFSYIELLRDATDVARHGITLEESGQLGTSLALTGYALNAWEYAGDMGQLDLLRHELTKAGALHMLGRNPAHTTELQSRLKADSGAVGGARSLAALVQAELVFRECLALERAAFAYSPTSGIIHQEGRDSALDEIYTALEKRWGTLRTLAERVTRDASRTPEGASFYQEILARTGLTEATERRIFEADDLQLTRLNQLQGEMPNANTDYRARLLAQMVNMQVGRLEAPSPGEGAPTRQDYFEGALTVAAELKELVSGSLSPEAAASACLSLVSLQLAARIHGLEDPRLGRLPECAPTLVGAATFALQAGRENTYLAAQQNLALHHAISGDSGRIPTDLAEALENVPEDHKLLRERTEELYRRALFAFGEE